MDILAISVQIYWYAHHIVQFPSHQNIQSRQARNNLEFLFSPLLYNICTLEPDVPAHLVISVLCLCFQVRPLSILCHVLEKEFTFYFQICALRTRKTAHLVEETVLKLISMTSINLKCLPLRHLAFGSWMKGFLNYFLWAETLTSEGCSMSISYVCQPWTETAKNVS